MRYKPAVRPAGPPPIIIASWYSDKIASGTIVLHAEDILCDSLNGKNVKYKHDSLFLLPCMTPA
jgi:hypothetical protein